LSNVKLLVISLEPAVNVSSVAVSPLSEPVIVSPEEKFTSLTVTYVIGEIGLITLAIAPEVAPVISSPLVNVPVAPVIVHWGRTGSAAESSESNTAQSLWMSATPSEISLWWADVPYSAPPAIPSLSLELDTYEFLF